MIPVHGAGRGLSHALGPSCSTKRWAGLSLGLILVHRAGWGQCRVSGPDPGPQEARAAEYPT